MTKCTNEACSNESQTKSGQCRACYQKKYREENKEKLRIKKNEYNAANREHVNKVKNEYKKAHRKNTPKQYAQGGPCKTPGCTEEATTLDGFCRSCYQKNYRAANKEKLSEQRRTFRQENAEKVAQQKRDHYERNKEKILEKCKDYYEENKEYKQAYQREYYRENREECNERHRKYYFNNKEILLKKGLVYRQKVAEHRKEQQREYHYENKESRNQRSKDYYNKNKSRYRENFKTYYQNNKNVFYHHNSIRRARLAGAEGSHTEAEWQEVLKEFDYTCPCCGAKDIPLHKDHIIPISKGGSNYIKNIQVLCKNCNSAKHTKTFKFVPWHKRNS